MKSKKIALLSLLALALTFTAFHKADAQRFYVSVRPVEPVYVHPVRPSPRHVWVESEWEWRNGAYVHHPGYWALPPRHYHVWVAGHWEHENRGHYWIPGHWGR